MFKGKKKFFLQPKRNLKDFFFIKIKQILYKGLKI